MSSVSQSLSYLFLAHALMLLNPLASPAGAEPTPVAIHPAKPVPAGEAPGVKYLRTEAGAAVYEVGSGSYRFLSSLPH